MDDIILIKSELKYITNLFIDVVNIIPSFDVANPKILPYGLKPHTRSISWITEQVISQQAKYNAGLFGLRESDIEINLPDTCLHDLEISNQAKRYFVNIKITNIRNKKKSKMI